ncbi:MAG: hypothetical protein L3K26_13150 [Candidatus Hydrogenedentes bacterium]|nr:hypothetical protein [Candidatus Hydrogenedentota bacterium]
MPEQTTADAILPLTARLSRQERIRLICLIAAQGDTDVAVAYVVAPPTDDEFSSDEEALAWEAEGWEEFD